MKRAGETPAAARVRVLPNGNTVGLAALVVAMWYAGASQSNGTAYLLCFTLIGVTGVSAVHAWANLRGLSVVAGPIEPVFAGEELRVPLVVHGSARRGHSGLRARVRGAPHWFGSVRWEWFRHPGLRVRARGAPLVPIGAVRPEAPQRTEIGVGTTRRGWYSEVSIDITSLYPLGFFTASMRVALRQGHWVYPKPDGRLPLPRSLAGGREHRLGLRLEGDDFAGVRPYRRGESQRHIDWKAVARGQPMLVKQWAGQGEEPMQLDWHELGALEPEARLSQLARWVILAERRGDRYSLRLPGFETAVSSGERHMHECLRRLAEVPA